MPEQRKVVSILFADVVGSTAAAARVDPEVARTQMTRYFRRISEIAETYGGTVEKFAGDAAMVVFGVPSVHDDDAERAVRAALEIRDGSTELTVRVGVNTGEAMTGAADAREFMVSGDAVNVAARLQQGAEAGEVVVGELTHRLTERAIEYRPREPIAAKGKPEPLVAYRAERPRTQVPVQPRGVPGLQASLVGRVRELRLLLDTFARAAEDRTPHLFTLVGAAGIGKSRLIREALTRLEDSGARVMFGRCLPYGRGITYWPLIEMLDADMTISLADDHNLALAKLDRRLGEVLAADAQLPALRARLSVMLGFETAEVVMPDTPAPRVEKEIGWAVRRYMTAVAQAAPLILVIDDVQWAEPPVLGVVEELVERLSDAPMVVVCVARPEFIETHPGWSAGKANAATLTLDPLNAIETQTLISRLLEIEALPPELMQEIVKRSAGTPLFCEEFIHMLVDEGLLVREGSSWHAARGASAIRVPHGVHAVLAARLDLLPPHERQILQSASVIGERFELGQLRGLIQADGVEAGIESLRRKGLVAGGDGLTEQFSFRHLLIRDAAYTSLPKSERAALHARFREVLEAGAADPNQIAEILAHHAEEAFVLSREVAVETDALLSRARQALIWSLAAADRARNRHDLPTLGAALETARSASTALPDGGGLELRARLRLLEAQSLVMSAHYRAAEEAAEDAARLAADANLPSLVARARLTEAWVWNFAGDSSIDDYRRVVERAVAAATEAGDLAAEIEARHVASQIAYSAGRLDEYLEINKKLLDRARSIDDGARAAMILGRLSHVELLMGRPGEASTYLAEADAYAAKLGLRNVALRSMGDRAFTHMQAADFGSAMQAHEDVVKAAEEAGDLQIQVNALRFKSYVLQKQHRFDEMALVLDRAIALSESTGERWNRAELYALRARAAIELGAVDAAEGFIGQALATVRDADVTGTSEVSAQLGVIRAAQGRDTEAEAALRRSMELIRGTDYWWPLADAGIDLARFLAQRGRAAEARLVLEEIAAGWPMHEGEIAAVRDLIEARERD